VVVGKSLKNLECSNVPEFEGLNTCQRGREEREQKSFVPLQNPTVYIYFLKKGTLQRKPLERICG
jgi:hypothetical protein